MKQITAKFNSTCAETGIRLKKGDTIYFDLSSRKAYHPSARIVVNYLSEGKSLRDYIEAQEEAYWNNLTNGYYLN